VKVGDLVIHRKDFGIITHIWKNGDICVFFEDGEHQIDVDDDDLEVFGELS
jgi:hypothetical protein|tara:strand:- start:1389 stop:1541 length:153 start_codon:yes stop_codon:yes gene_type:complete